MPRMRQTLLRHVRILDMAPTHPLLDTAVDSNRSNYTAVAFQTTSYSLFKGKWIPNRLFLGEWS